MRASAMFPSEYLRAADLGSPALVTIKTVEIREVGDERKPVIFFLEKDKGVVLNKTKNNFLIDAFGDDTDGWSGKKIVIQEGVTQFQGKQMACIDFRKPKMPVKEEMNDEVPF